MSGPTCEHCGAPMLVRTARKGRNAGGQFFGCSAWRPREEHSTWPIEDPRGAALLGVPDAPEPQPPTEARPSGMPARATTITTVTRPVQRKVTWADAAVLRSGWLSSYTAGGARLRCLPGELAQSVRNDLGTCWVAAEELPSYEPSDDETARVVGMMHKVLQRGALPPVPPTVEQAILDASGVETKPRGDRLIGVSPTKRIAAKTLQPHLGWWRTGSPDDELDLGSDEERIVLDQLLAEAVLARFVSAQAPLESLVLGLGGEIDPGSRRVDFFVGGSDPIVVEVDGLQHGGSGVDADRDEALRGVGVTVQRISASNVRAGLLPPVLADVDSGGADHAGWHLLVHGPVQAHRLVLALLEGVQRGFLGQRSWVVQVHDPTSIGHLGVPGYLRVLAAIDELWGDLVAPDWVEVDIDGERSAWERRGSEYVAVEPRNGDLDLVVHLDLGLTPLHRMPSGDGRVPRIVVRDAVLPVELLLNSGEPNDRVRPRLPADRTEVALRVLLQSVFGFEDFEDGQLTAITEVLHGRDCVVLLPTGAGKSLVYQLAGLVLPGRTLVVDPLVSLMEDQVRGLRDHGIDRTLAISSYTTQTGAIEAALEQVSSGDALFVFVSPERLQNPRFRTALRALTVQSPLNLAVVDEAHCVSEWGHDFRTAYLNLGRTLRRLGRDGGGEPPPVLALTGTASRAVLRDVLVELAIEQNSPNTLVKPRTFDRPELRFEILPATPMDAEATLIGVISGMPARFRRQPASFFKPAGENTMSGLVFVPHVNGAYGTQEVARRLASVVVGQVPAYSGSPPRGFDSRQWDTLKREMADQFMSGSAPVMVATKSFGMGIDKSNVRYVVHYGIPGSIESYYQEAGRAGRDRGKSICALVLSELDQDRNRRLLDEDVDLELIRSDPARAGSARDSDDVDRQLFFHTNAFAGVDDEMSILEETLRELGDVGRSHVVSVGFGSDRSARERGIHRLALLSVVDDYTVDFGAKEFGVHARSSTAGSIVESFLSFVERSQPGRRSAYESHVEQQGWEKVDDAILGCGRLVIEFIYDTIERARRRSLREMLLAARESRGDDDFRRRLLDYLQEGDVAPVLERLVDMQGFAWGAWLDAFGTIDTQDSAQEWRGGTARLLASYPDNPGLLLARAVAEASLVDGDQEEIRSNVTAALRSARTRFGLAPEESIGAVESVIRLVVHRRRGEMSLALLEGASEEMGSGRQARMLEELLDRVPESVPLSNALLPLRLRDLVAKLDEIVSMEVSA